MSKVCTHQSNQSYNCVCQGTAYSDQCCGSGMIYSGSRSSFEFSEFRIHVIPDPTHIIYVYLEIIKKHESTNYLPCSTVFRITVLQYTQSRIHRPKRRNKILIYLLCHFLLDPDQEKGPDPCESRSATLLKQFLDSR